jgi:hypothetical protein
MSQASDPYGDLWQAAVAERARRSADDTDLAALQNDSQLVSCET